jgi:succinyl-CoA synthetase alpha subunit
MKVRKRQLSYSNEGRQKMSILVNKDTKLVVQGITGRDGSFHTSRMVKYGTNVVAGVTPGKGGQKVEGIPVFNSVAEAVEKTDANTSVLFVPARFAVSAVYEAIDGGVKLVVCISEGIPTIELVKIVAYSENKNCRLVGPNSPGVISAGEAKVGILPGHIFNRGSVGVISRSGTLTYEIVDHITKVGLGQSTCIGIGGDPIIGTKFIDCLELFARDDATEAVVLVGEIGGRDEQDTAEYVKANFKKPVFGFIAGKTAPSDKRMGHAGAIISGTSGTAEEKVKIFKECGIKVGDTPAEVAELVKNELK